MVEAAVEDRMLAVSHEIASMRYPSSVLKVVLCGLDYAGMGGHQQNVQG